MDATVDALWAELAAALKPSRKKSGPNPAVAPLVEGLLKTPAGQLRLRDEFRAKGPVSRSIHLYHPLERLVPMLTTDLSQDERTLWQELLQYAVEASGGAGVGRDSTVYWQLLGGWSAIGGPLAPQRVAHELFDLCRRTKSKVATALAQTTGWKSLDPAARFRLLDQAVGCAGNPEFATDLRDQADKLRAQLARPTAPVAAPSPAGPPAPRPPAEPPATDPLPAAATTDAGVTDIRPEPPPADPVRLPDPASPVADAGDEAIAAAPPEPPPKPRKTAAPKAPPATADPTDLAAALRGLTAHLERADRTAELERVRTELTAAGERLDRLEGEVAALRPAAEVLAATAGRLADAEARLVAGDGRVADAERRADRNIRQAERDRDAALLTFRAELWDRLRPNLLDVPETPSAGAGGDLDVYLIRLQAVRDALRAAGVPPG